MIKTISFIVPTYNRAGVLLECIQSVIKQQGKNWELIIVDDGSTDDTLNSLQPFLKDDRVKYVFQENSGVSVARNRGASLAKGEYLIFLDSDDVVLPSLLNELNESLFYKYDVICWQVRKIIGRRVELWKPEKLDLMYNGITASFLAGSVCYSKRLFNDVGGYDPKLFFGENYELGLRVSRKENLKIKIIHSTLSQYNLPQKRTSDSVSNRLSSYIHLYEKHKNLYEKDSKSHSGINYLLGYVHEQRGKLKEAKAYYLNSSKIDKWNYKAHLKNLYFALFK